MRTALPLLPRRRLLLATTASLVVTACGGGGADSSNMRPVAAARLSGQAVLNATTTFDTTGTNDPDGNIASSSWDYGDGKTGTGNTHIYATTGSFTASYTVTDNRGASSSVSVPLTVAKCSAAGAGLAATSLYPTACMQTTAGEMVIELYNDKAPFTVANFLQYVDDGFYSGTLFHRVIANFVAQAGGYTTGPTAKTATHSAIVLESNTPLKNVKYSVAMARTSVANSATSQFFINLVDNHSLDYVSATSPGYAVFAQVISGTAVVDSIGNVATGPAGGLTDVPIQDIAIRSVVRLP